MPAPQSTKTALVALVLLALGLRLLRLNFQPLWGDEGWSLYFASMKLGEMLSKTAVDIHPPLYYALLHLWLQVCGYSPLSARLLSVFFGVCLVPLSYLTGRQLFSRPVGLVSALIVTVAPFAIYYSQEVRMYGLVTLLGLASIYFFARLIANRELDTSSGEQASRSPWLLWAGYVLTTSAAIYTMYYALFLVMAQSLYLVALVAARRSTWRKLGIVWGGLAVTAILYLPWAAYAGAKLVTYIQGKRVAEGYLPLDAVRFLTAHLVAFSVGHLSPAFQWLAWTGFLFAGLAAFGVVAIVHYGRRDPRDGDCVQSGHQNSWLLLAYLLVPLALGYAVNLVYPFTPADFERTLLIAAPAWWILIAAGLVWLWRRARTIAVVLGLLALALQGLSLYGFYTVPRYRDDDYRYLLSLVRAHSTPDDVILASYQWQLGLYYAYLPTPHPTFYQVPEWGAAWADSCTQMQNDLDGLLGQHPRLWFPAYQSLGHLWESNVEQTLDQMAYPTIVDWNVRNTKLSLYGGYGVLQTILGSDEDATQTTDVLDFGHHLAVTQVQLGQAPLQAGRGIIPVSLTWQVLDQSDEEYHIALRLADANGRTWVNRDSLPQAGAISFADLVPGTAIVDHHGLLVPAGTPPGQYQLYLSVYAEGEDRPLDLVDTQGQPQGTEANLAPIEIVVPDPPLTAQALPPHMPLVSKLGEDIKLLGYSLPEEPLAAGSRLDFDLFWQAVHEVKQPYIVFAQLQDDTGQPVALSEVPPVLPTDRWPAGMLLRDPHSILLPPTLPAGEYRLAVGMLRSDGTRLSTGRGDQVILTNVETTQRPHTYQAPSPQNPEQVRFDELAQLVGYDIAPSTTGYARPGGRIELTLYWQALGNSERGYTIFCHLVNAEGNIFGQHDQPPGGGEWPTTSWVPGEYFADRYTLPVNPDTPPGTYWIEIGFYDPLDGFRLPVIDGQGQATGDHWVLNASPITVQ